MTIADAPSKARIRITSLVLADEVRREESGKDIIIGAYASTIMVGEFPARLGLALWYSYEALAHGETGFAFRAMPDLPVTEPNDPAPEALFAFECKCMIKTPGPEGAGAFFLRGIVAELAKPGAFRLEYKHDTDVLWTRAGWFRVIGQGTRQLPVHQSASPS